MLISERAEYASKPKPMTMPETNTVADAVSAMTQRNFGSVIATDKAGKLSGLFTERDLMRRVVNEGLDPKKTKLSEVMTRELRVAKADDEVHDWLRIMSNERFRRLPVVDDNGDIIAIMTQGDFVSYTWPDLINQARDLAAGSIPRDYQLYLIGGAMLIYSVVLVWFLS